MKRLIAIATTFLLTLSPGARALTVAPLPDVAGQSTPEATYFPTPFAVEVTDASGAPVAGVQVDFINTDGIVFFADAGLTFSGHELAYTDGNGIATAAGLVGFLAGSTTVTASTVGSEAASVAIPLTVLPGGTVRWLAISGGNQHVMVNTAYPDPWVAQAFDQNGNPVPRAAAMFYASSDPTLPSVLFNGSNSAWVQADANGFAVSPYFSANAVAGRDEGTVVSFRGGGSVESAFFPFSNQPAGGSGGGTGDGCGRQGKGNGNCGNSPAHSGGNGNNGNGKG